MLPLRLAPSLLAVILTSPLAAQEDWRDVTPAVGGPGVRFGHAMAFDAARGVTVLFGGREGISLFGDTWTFDGTTWTQVATTGPAPRENHAMAYDATRQRVVLFGGLVGGPITGSYGNDVWEWDGTSWTQAQPSTPPPPTRAYHAMTAYPAAGGVVVSGGYGNVLRHFRHGDLWLWDGSTWLDLTDPTTPTNAEHTLAYHAGLQRLVMFGGEDFEYETLLYDGSSGWVRESVSANPIEPRVSPRMVYDSRRDRLVVFGGGDPLAMGHYPSRTWSWRGVWTRREPALAPPGRGLFDMVYDSVRDRVVLHGGHASYYISSATYGDTWELEPVPLPPPFVSGEVSGFGLGTGCGRFTNAPFLRSRGGVRPWLGQPFTLEAGPIGDPFFFPATATLVAGTSSTSWGGVPLPYAFSALGRPDCSLLVRPDVTWAQTSRGNVAWSLPLPNCPSCAGTTVLFQVVGLDMGRLATTNGLEVVLGRL